jgi:hypothetical protein
MSGKKSSVSKGRSYTEIGEYWDEHDLGEVWEETKPIEIEVAIRSKKHFDEQDQELEARSRAFQVEIEQRMASGPATPMDFSELKKSIRKAVKSRKADPQSS